MRNRLKLLRLEKKLTLRDLADKTNISYPTLSRLETHQTTFNEQNLILLSRFFDVSIDYLLGYSENRKNETEKGNEIVNNQVFDDFQFALYGEVKDLTEEQKQDILEMVKLFKKHSK